MSKNTNYYKQLLCTIRDADIREVDNTLAIVTGLQDIQRAYLNRVLLELCIRADKEFIELTNLKGSLVTIEQKMISDPESFYSDDDSFYDIEKSPEYYRCKTIESFIRRIVDISKDVRLEDYTINPDSLVVSLAMETRENFDSYTTNIALDFLFKCLREGYFIEDVMKSVLKILGTGRYSEYSTFTKLNNIICELIEITEIDLKPILVKDLYHNDE